jgi:hypothetical protein
LLLSTPNQKCYANYCQAHSLFAGQRSLLSPAVTQEVKRISSRNAMSHGPFARCTRVEGEPVKAPEALLTRDADRTVRLTAHRLDGIAAPPASGPGAARNLWSVSLQAQGRNRILDACRCAAGGPALQAPLFLARRNTVTAVSR